MITGIDHVQVAAPPGCEPAARSFYGGLLELAEVDKPEVLAARGGCWFAVGGQQLHVGVAQPFTPSAKAHPALHVGDRAALETLAARLQAGGYTGGVGRRDPRHRTVLRARPVRQPAGARGSG